MTQPETAPAARTDAAQWTGANGDVWAEEWQRTDRSFAPLTAELDRTINEAMDRRALAVADIGSGAGGTSITAASANGAAQVTGFDISPALVAVAQERAAGLPNCRFVAGPAEQRIGEVAPFDLIVSRHGVMFFDDPADAFTRLRAAARPGAGLVFSCFRGPSLNAWARELMAVLPGGGAKSAGYEPGPFAFADADFVRTLLAEAGWTDVAVRPVDFAYRAGEGSDAVADALTFFSRIGPAARALKLAPPEQHGEILARTEAICRARLIADVVEFPAAAWIWSARNPS